MSLVEAEDVCPSAGLGLSGISQNMRLWKTPQGLPIPYKALKMSLLVVL